MGKALPNYHMRPAHKELRDGVSALVPSDREFLLQLYASTRAEELELGQFPKDQRMAFCAMQLRLRDTHYQRFYPQAEDRIIELDGTAIGHELIDRAEPVILLMDIALLPDYRNLGIGSDLLRKLLLESDQSGRTVCLHVEKESPARRLYQRYGFEITEDCELQWEMRRKPNLPA